MSAEEAPAHAGHTHGLGYHEDSPHGDHHREVAALRSALSDLLEASLNLLVLKDGPRDTPYYATKHKAWAALRDASVAARSVLGEPG